MNREIGGLFTFAAIFPEVVLAVGAMAILMIGVFRHGEKAGKAAFIDWLALGVLVIAGADILLQHDLKEPLFKGSFLVDPFARFMKLLVLIGAAGAIVLAVNDMRRSGYDLFEYPVLVLLSAAGMCLMISANDLITLYVGLELQNLALYVVAAIRRNDVRSSEAGLKYFVLGALSSGMLLYGASLVYGFTGATNFNGIAAAVKAAGPLADNLGLLFGLVFVLAGLAFKVSAVPFHMWTPDVYEGSPTPVAAFFAVAPKLAAMALLVRTVMTAFPAALLEWQQILTFLAIASMVLGAFAAIGQTNIKRLMGYSSIGHVGYALVGLAAGTAEGAQGVLIYLAIYLAMTLGTFAAILAMRRASGPVEDIGELAGLARNDPATALILAIMLFSLAGIPPVAGFFAKFYVFLAAINAKLYALAVIGVVASCIGAYYYLRIVKIMYMDEPAERFERVAPSLRFVLVATGAFVLLYVTYPAPLVAGAEIAARALR
ncbi:MAG: NADH-quinone oxidoreductase subunit NuoN [Hyphomicrobiaceae bacterium]|nr:MAG: NADH-quinone oxidoreductase subunit NuoN [Hyphomicrobiaceae bacterium]